MPILDFWRDAPQSRRAGFIVSAILALAAALAAVTWLLVMPGYETLFSGLESRDMATVTRELDTLGVDYRADRDSGTVQVKSDEVHRARVAVMSGVGPLRNVVGFELFDDVDFGMTEFTQRVNYQRALQGELTRTITSLDEIRQARLHLAMPEGSLFEREQEQPSASLAVSLRDDRSLTPERISGIRHLVAAAVPGLSADKVTVHDQNGVNLTPQSSSDDPMVQAMPRRLEAKRRIEAYLRGKLHSVLDQLYPEGGAVVSVDAVLDHDRIQSQYERVLGEGNSGKGVLVHMEKRSLQSPSKRNSEAPLDHGENAKSNSDGPVDMQAEYAVGREIQEITVTPGSIRRITVGVVVPHELTAEREAALRRLLVNVVGMDTSRGDSLAIHVQSHIAEEGGQKDGERVATPASRPGFDTGDVESSEDLSGSPWASISLSREESIFAMILMALLLGFLGVSAAFWSQQRRLREVAVTRPDLTEEQRDALLAQLRMWLDDEQDDDGDRESHEPV